MSNETSDHDETDATDMGAVAEVLDTKACIELLGGANFGRLAINHGGQPEIFPVNYALDGERVVIRSGEGTKLRHASLDRVAFEVDGGAGTDEAWSVVVKGTAREITSALDDASVRERTLPLVTTAPIEGEAHWLRIVPQEITGRRLRRPKP